MVTVKLLHDGRFIEELDPFVHARRLVHSFDGHPRFRLAFDDAFGDALVHHTERALTELPAQRDFLSLDFPFIWHVHYTNIAEGDHKSIAETHQ